MTMTCWRKLLTDEMSIQGETFDDIVSSTLTQESLNAEFDAGYGAENGAPFTVWTTHRVYFPTTYDGSEDVASVSRNPDGKPTSHIGQYGH